MTNVFATWSQSGHKVRDGLREALVHADVVVAPPPGGGVLQHVDAAHVLGGLEQLAGWKRNLIVEFIKAKRNVTFHLLFELA